MKYPVVFILKLICAILYCLAVVAISIIVLVLNLVWNLKWGLPYDRLWELDCNDDFVQGTIHSNDELIYKTPFHWLFNGNYSNFK